MTRITKRKPTKKQLAELKKALAPKVLTHKLGDRHDVEGVLCSIRFENCGIGFLFPIIDDPDDTMVARHICYAKIDEYGQITRI